MYAFSVDNFHRSPSEVRGLMALATAKFSDMVSNISTLHAVGARVAVIGDLGRLPVDVQTAAVEAMESTAGNTRLLLNICFSYGSHMEIAHSLTRTLFSSPTLYTSKNDTNVSSSTGADSNSDSGCDSSSSSCAKADYESESKSCPDSDSQLRSRSLQSQSLTQPQMQMQPQSQSESQSQSKSPHTESSSRTESPASVVAAMRYLESSLYTAGLPEPDLLIRTSGETRLSDFLLWQSGGTHLAFTDTLWPEFSYWDWAKILMDYQAVAAEAASVKGKVDAEQEKVLHSLFAVTK